MSLEPLTFLCASLIFNAPAVAGRIFIIYISYILNEGVHQAFFFFFFFLDFHETFQETNLV